MKNTSADGLRGLAALNVAITHFVAAFLPWLLYNNFGPMFPRYEGDSILAVLFSSPLLTLFYNGHFAVLVFFVLSGYVLTLPYYTSPDAGTSLRRRLWARYLRLNLPIVAAVGLAWLCYRLGLFHHLAAAPLSGSMGWLAVLYPSGLDFMTALREAFGAIVIGKSAFVPPLWTLRIEFVGSLYILLFYIVKPAGRTWLPMALVCLLLHALHGDQSLYFLAIFGGAALHHMRPGSRAQCGLFVAGLYFGAFQSLHAMYVFLPTPHIWDAKTTYNAIGAMCLCAAVLSGFGKRFLGLPVVQFLGKVSYSVYLLHFVILFSLSTWLYVLWPREPLYLAAGFVAYLAVCLACGCLFERWVDRSAIRLSRRFGAFMCPDARIVTAVPQEGENHPPLRRAS